MDIEGAAQETQTKTPPAEVIVTDVNISFGNLVGLMVKCAFAVIPAAIIIGFVIAVVVAILRPTVPL